MAQARDEYLSALGRYRQATKRIASTVGIVRAVAQELSKNPQRFQFANSKTPMPIGTPDPIFDAKDWPSAIDIQRAIAAWCEAFEAVNKAWLGVPQNERDGIEKPPHALEL